MAQDDYYYEIQLTNKQLVFYFMAGATGLILSFLAGVMVGRGLDGGDVQAARAVQEDRIVAEEPATPPSPAPAASDLTYAQRLEGERVEDSLERPKPTSSGSGADSTKAGAPPRTDAGASRRPAAPRAGTGAEARSSRSSAAAKAEPASPKKPAPAAAREPEPSKSVTGTFTVQVGAFKDKSTAESVVARLKGKGFAAYFLTPDGSDTGLFVVRVGSYPARADAERIEARLRDEERFKPYIVRN